MGQVSHKAALAGVQLLHFAVMPARCQGGQRHKRLHGQPAEEQLVAGCVGFGGVDSRDKNDVLVRVQHAGQQQLAVAQQDRVGVRSGLLERGAGQAGVGVFDCAVTQKCKGGRAGAEDELLGAGVAVADAGRGGEVVGRGGRAGSGAGGGEVAFHATDGALVLEHGLGFQCVELVAEGAAGQRTAREGESKGEKDKGETDGAGHGKPPFGVGV